MFGVMRVGSVVWLVVILAENRLGHYIFLRRPVAQVLQLAAFAAKGKSAVNLGVGRLLANRTTVSHALTSLSGFLLPILGFFDKGADFAERVSFRSASIA
jgi:hypothetical protein